MSSVVNEVENNQETPRDLTTRVVKQWAEDIQLEGVDLQESISMLAGRAHSWLSPASVAAGVNDIIFSDYDVKLRSISKESSIILADRLSNELNKLGWLGKVSAKRGGMLS